jgi:hypothetical protein
MDKDCYNMNKSISLVGIYQKTGNYFLSNSQKYLIKDRVKVTKGKANKFVLSLTDSKKPRYISSLYPTGKDNIYYLEYRYVNYIVTVKTDTVTISLKK